MARTPEETALVAAQRQEAVQTSRRAQLSEMLNDITERGLEAFRGLGLKADEDGYNPDADRPWQEHSGRTHMGMTVYKEHMAGQRERQATERALGVILLKNRMEEKEWEAQAQRVDRGDAIDVEAEEA